MVTIKKILTGTHIDELRDLHILCLPSDEHEDYLKGDWWLAFEAGSPVAFAGSREVPSVPEWVYLSRVGVLPSHRGQGLQRRLMGCVEKDARKRHVTAVMSSTYLNPPSANNFVKRGYLMYSPDTPWGAVGTCYWLKSLTSP